MTSLHNFRARQENMRISYFHTLPSYIIRRPRHQVPRSNRHLGSCYSKNASGRLKRFFRYLITSDSWTFHGDVEGFKTADWSLKIRSVRWNSYPWRYQDVYDVGKSFDWFFKGLIENQHWKLSFFSCWYRKSQLKHSNIYAFLKRLCIIRHLRLNHW